MVIVWDTLFLPNPHPDRYEVFRLFWAYQPARCLVEGNLEPPHALEDSYFLERPPPSLHDLRDSAKFGNIRFRTLLPGYFFDCPDPAWLSKDGSVTAMHVSLSLELKLSLIHSAALAVGKCTAELGNIFLSSLTKLGQTLNIFFARATQLRCCRPVLTSYRGSLRRAGFASH